MQDGGYFYNEIYEVYWFLETERHRVIPIIFISFYSLQYDPDSRAEYR